MSLSNSYRIRRVIFAVIVTLLMFSGQSWALTLPHDPPPPQGPPPTEINDVSSLLVIFIRDVLEDEGDMVIDEHNMSSPHKLSWAPGARPIECGYNCVGPPFMTSTRFLDQPNQNIAQIFAHLDFDIDINNLPFTRRIRTNITIRAACSGWRDGSGEINVFVDVDPPFIIDNGGASGLIEDILDFLFLPFNLSNQIEARIEAGLGAGSSSSAPVPSGDCRSLSVFSNTQSGRFSLDQILWNQPEREPIIGVVGEISQEAHITAQFESITRKQTLSALGTETDLSFVLYINGQPIFIPQAGTMNIPPGATRSLQNVGATFTNDSDFDTLQIIVADSLGGAGWQQFDEASQYGEGSQLLYTHRTEIVPIGSTFDLSGINGGPSKPTPIDVHEFEVAYSVNVTNPGVLAPP